MHISDICTHHVIGIEASATVHEAAESMRKNHVGALVVVEKPNGERIPIGIITDRDIVVAVVATGADPQMARLADVMSKPVATCTEDEGLFSAIETMRERGVRRLPVLNAKGGLTGIVTADDIFGALGSHMQDLGHAFTREQTHEMLLRA